MWRGKKREVRKGTVVWRIRSSKREKGGGVSIGRRNMGCAKEGGRKYHI